MTGEFRAPHGYKGLPLPGSPAARLRDETVKGLASGQLPRCPHPDEPAFWYLPAGMLACVACADRLIEAAGDEPAACHACGEPASVVAAWITDGVPCVAGLCEQCRNVGLVPLSPN